jgi:hypothetical protein
MLPSSELSQEGTLTRTDLFVYRGVAYSLGVSGSDYSLERRNARSGASLGAASSVESGDGTPGSVMRCGAFGTLWAAIPQEDLTTSVYWSWDDGKTWAFLFADPRQNVAVRQVDRNVGSVGLLSGRASYSLFSREDGSVLRGPLDVGRSDGSTFGLVQTSGDRQILVYVHKTEDWGSDDAWAPVGSYPIGEPLTMYEGLPFRGECDEWVAYFGSRVLGPTFPSNWATLDAYGQVNPVNLPYGSKVVVYPDAYGTSWLSQFEEGAIKVGDCVAWLSVADPGGWGHAGVHHSDDDGGLFASTNISSDSLHGMVQPYSVMEATHAPAFGIRAVTTPSIVEYASWDGGATFFRRRTLPVS